MCCTLNQHGDILGACQRDMFLRASRARVFIVLAADTRSGQEQLYTSHSPMVPSVEYIQRHIVTKFPCCRREAILQKSPRLARLQIRSVRGL